MQFFGWPYKSIFWDLAANRPESGWCTEKLSQTTSMTRLSLQMCFCKFSGVIIGRVSSPCRPASTFLLPGCLKARRIQRLPLCTEPAPKVSVAPDNFVSELAWLMHLCVYCESSVFWRFAALDVSQQTLEVSVYHVRRFHLLVRVFKIQLVLFVLGQLFSFWPFKLPFAFGFLPFLSKHIDYKIRTLLLAFINL